MRKPQPKYVPLPCHRADKDAELMAHLEGAYFLHKGKWILYYFDGRYISEREVQKDKDYQEKNPVPNTEKEPLSK